MGMELCMLHFAFSATKAPRACEKPLKCVWWIVGWNLPLGGLCFFGEAARKEEMKIDEGNWCAGCSISRHVGAFLWSPKTCP